MLWRAGKRKTRNLKLSENCGRCESAYSCFVKDFEAFPNFPVKKLFWKSLSYPFPPQTSTSAPPAETAARRMALPAPTSRADTSACASAASSATASTASRHWASATLRNRATRTPTARCFPVRTWTFTVHYADPWFESVFYNLTFIWLQTHQATTLIKLFWVQYPSMITLFYPIKIFFFCTSWWQPPAAGLR